jgi:hypothetical protein
MASNKQGQKAFSILQEWREQGAPAYITAHEAFNLTGGIIGKRHGIDALRLVDVAMKYAEKEATK